MSKTVELLSHEIDLVAGGEGCIDPNPGGPTVDQLIQRMLHPVPLTVEPIN